MIFSWSKETVNKEEEKFADLREIRRFTKIS